MTNITTTWDAVAADGIYTNIGNWDFGVPSTFDYTAIFANSNHMSISISSNIEVGEWIFYPAASSYLFTIDPGSTVRFFSTGITMKGGGATIGNNGNLLFYENSSAGGAGIYSSGHMGFFDVSTAGSAAITNSSLVEFKQNSTAGNAAILTMNGAALHFEDYSNGGNAQLFTDAGGTVDFMFTAGPSNNNQLTVGAIAGAGTYVLGANQLIVGGNGLSTTVSGAIENGPLLPGFGGSLIKVGTGALQLSGAGNTYSHGTLLEGGTLDLAAPGAAGTGAIAFGGVAHLAIENAALPRQVFGNRIDFFGNHDVIDLTGLHFHAGAKAKYHPADHTLTVTSHGVTDTLTLFSPLRTHFRVANDGHGGTKVTLAPVKGTHHAAVVVSHDAIAHPTVADLPLSSHDASHAGGWLFEA
jgi:autotransporter-associated beta strand protein/predicted outer membrane repeat protein